MGEEGVSLKVTVVAVLLVAAMIAGGVYLLTAPTLTTTTTTPPPTTTTTTTTGPTEPPVSVLVWHSLLEDEANVAENAIATSFRQRYPGINIEFKNVMDMRTRLLVALPAGKGPDVFTWAHDWTGEFATAGYIEPLDEFLTPGLMEKFTSSAVEACTYNGKIWALPYAGETVALVYNKAMVSDPPETMDELVAAMEDAMAQGRYGIAYQIDPYFVSAWVHAFGGWYWSDDNRTVGINSEGTIRGLRYLIDTFRPYMVADPTGTVQTGVFLEKMAPFFVTGPWSIPSIEAAGIDYGVVPLPRITEIDKMPEPFTGVKVMWMSSSAKDKEEAFNFMEWFTTDLDHILERTRKARFIPVLNEALEVGDIAADPFVIGFSEAVGLGRPMPRGPEMMIVWGPFGDALMEAWMEPERLEGLFNEAQAAAEARIAEVYG